MDIDFFIKKFNNLEDHFFTESWDRFEMDAWGWCTNEESIALLKLVKPYGLLILVNDGVGEWKNWGRTPKERVLRFLNFIKRMESKAA